MADAAQIADLLTKGIAGSQGPEDIAFHTGVVKSWDKQTGINVVTINGVDIPNLKAWQGGIPNWFTAGDIVFVMRKQTQYFIAGRVSAPGGAAGSGPARATSNFGTSFGTGGLWADNPSFPNTPQLSVYLGNSRACVVMWQCNITTSSGDPAASATTFNANVWGEVGWAVSGASTQAAGAFSGTSVTSQTQFGNPGALQWVTNMITVSGIYTTIGALNTGLNTFTMKYRTPVGITATFGNPQITVIPL